MRALYSSFDVTLGGYWVLKRSDDNWLCEWMNEFIAKKKGKESPPAGVICHT